MPYDSTDYAAVAPVVPGTRPAPKVMPRGLWVMERFVAWLETMPPEQSYDYCDCKRCLLSQYLRHRGKWSPIVGPYSWTNWILWSRPIPEIFNDIAVGRGGSNGGRTYGAALARARSACGLSQPKGGGL